MVYGIIALLALLVDQFLKFWTVSNVALNTGIRPLIPGFLHITYIKNFGAAFGVMSSFGALRWILLILLIAFTALMVFAFIKGYFRTGLTKVSGALLLAGLLGNGIDLGYVPDAQLAVRIPEHAEILDAAERPGDAVDRRRVKAVSVRAAETEQIFHVYGCGHIEFDLERLTVIAIVLTARPGCHVDFCVVLHFRLYLLLYCGRSDGYYTFIIPQTHGNASVFCGGSPEGQKNAVSRLSPAQYGERLKKGALSCYNNSRISRRRKFDD